MINIGQWSPHMTSQSNKKYIYFLCLLIISYHHKLTTRPDMEEIWWHAEVIIYRWDAQLHVGVRDVGLAVVEPRPLHHLLPDGGKSSVAANN